MSVSEMKLKHPELKHIRLIVLDAYASMKLTAFSGTWFYAGLEAANRICAIVIAEISLQKPHYRDAAQQSSVTARAKTNRIPLMKRNSVLPDVRSQFAPTNAQEQRSRNRRTSEREFRVSLTSSSRLAWSSSCMKRVASLYEPGQRSRKCPRMLRSTARSNDK
jgi:hypothetical protein